MTNVHKLFITDDDLEEAWLAFDAAARRLHSLYQDPDSDPVERRKASFEAATLEQEFKAAFARHNSRAAG